MEASRTPGAVGVGRVGKYALIRELSARTITTFVANVANGPPEELFIVERLAGTSAVVRAAANLMTLRHPNVARVRETMSEGFFVYVVSDCVDGAPFVSLRPRSPLDIQLRVIVDVLRGLSAIHGHVDGGGAPLEITHGDVSPSTVLIGADGSSRLVHLLRPVDAAPRIAVGGYVAPELLERRGGDLRADLYSVGVLLWEALTKSRLFPGGAASIVQKHAQHNIPRAEVPKSEAWASPLVDVATRALASNPSDRFASAAEMAGEISKIAKTKLALPLRVGAFVQENIGRATAEKRTRSSSSVRAISRIRATPDTPPPVVPASRRPPPPLVQSRPPEPIVSMAPPAPEVRSDAWLVTDTGVTSSAPKPVSVSLRSGPLETPARTRHRVVVGVLGACIALLLLAGARALLVRHAAPDQPVHAGAPSPPIVVPAVAPPPAASSAAVPPDAVPTTDESAPAVAPTETRAPKLGGGAVPRVVVPPSRKGHTSTRYNPPGI